MVLSDGDIIQVITRQSSGAVAFLNVDFRRYVDVGGLGNDLEELAEAYASNWNINVSDTSQHALTATDEHELNNMTNGMDFFVLPSAQLGGRAGLLMTTLACFTVKQIRRTKITRNGSKRISGISEGDTNGNLVTLGQALVNSVQAFFGSPVFFSDVVINDFSLDPVIVGRTLNIVTGVYELDLSRVNDVNGAIMSPTVRSQVSRKI